MKNIVLSLSMLFVISFFISCEHENERNISSYNSHESHNTGDDCTSCHKSGGEGEGWFTISGTVYDNLKVNPYPNSTVKLYTEANASGDLVYTVEVDSKGNFYTTEDVDFGSGLYTLVEGTEGIKFMISPITTGSCNSCHGISFDRIWAE